MLRGYKVRLFPTPEQEELLWKHIHACRFIWNYMLAYQQNHYKETNEYLGWVKFCKEITNVKNKEEYKWLYEVSNCSLQQVCRDLDSCYRELFMGVSNLPSFKTKKNKRQSFPLSQIKSKVYFKDENYLTVPIVKSIKYKTDRKFPIGNDVKIHNPRISYVNNKWIFSFCLPFENQKGELTDKNMGIDLGIKEFAVVAFGDDKIIYHNINRNKRIKTLEKKLSYITRKVDKKYRKHGNYEKTNSIVKYEKQMRDIFYKLSNIRKNYIHHITKELVGMNPKRITIETLRVQDMIKNKFLAHDIISQCFYEFARQLEYKCEQKGIEFVQADRWFPSSKTCSQCGEIKKDLKLSDRVYKCPCCGLEIDRDYNAAINLMNYSCPTE